MDCNLLENLKTEMNEMNRQRWSRKRQIWQEKDNMKETVTLANGNENNPFTFQFTTSLVEENLAENNLGPTTFYGQQIYVLYAPFSFLSY